MNTRNEAATVLILFLLYIIVLIVMGFPFGGPLGEVGEYIGLAILLGMCVVTVLCIMSKVCDDSSREKEMRRQIELEKQKIRKQNDDERPDWILR